MQQPIYNAGQKDKIIRMGEDNLISCRAHCPKCGAGPLDGCTSLSMEDIGSPTPNYLPKPGDFTICSACAEILVFSDEVLNLHLATDEELAAIKENKESWRLVELAVAAIKKAKNGR